MKKHILDQEERFHDQWANYVEDGDIIVDACFEACTAAENRQIIKWLGNINGKKVLELGCGFGEASVYLAKKGAEVTASDLSGGMLELAEKTAESHGVKIKTVKCSADQLPFSDHSFDIIYAANVFHHVDIQATLKECRRVLKRKGILVSYDPVDYNPVIKIYRKMASDVRTADEHPFKRSDIRLFQKYFSKVRYEGKWFFTNLIFLKFYFVDRIDPGKERYWIRRLTKHKELEPLYRRLEKADRMILRILPCLKWWCWNMVVIARK